MYIHIKLGHFSPINLTPANLVISQEKLRRQGENHVLCSHTRHGHFVHFLKSLRKIYYLPLRNQGSQGIYRPEATRGILFLWNECLSEYKTKGGK